MPAGITAVADNSSRRASAAFRSFMPQPVCRLATERRRSHEANFRESRRIAPICEPHWHWPPRADLRGYDENVVEHM